MEIQAILQQECYERRGHCLQFENANLVSTKRKMRKIKAVQQKHNTGQTYSKTKQQTTNKYLICNNIQTQEKGKTPNTNDQTLRTSNCAK